MEMKEIILLCGLCALCGKFFRPEPTNEVRLSVVLLVDPSIGKFYPFFATMYPNRTPPGDHQLVRMTESVAKRHDR